MNAEDLGPLPEPDYVRSEPPAFYKDEWKHTKHWTAQTVRAYALSEVEKATARERERCAKLVETQDTHGDYGVRAWFDVLAAKIRA